MQYNINKININIESKIITVVYSDKNGQRRIIVIQGQKFGLLSNKIICGTNKTTYQLVKQILFNFIKQQNLV